MPGVRPEQPFIQQRVRLRAESNEANSLDSRWKLPFVIRHGADEDAVGGLYLLSHQYGIVIVVY